MVSKREDKTGQRIWYRYRDSGVTAMRCGADGRWIREAENYDKHATTSDGGSFGTIRRVKRAMMRKTSGMGFFGERERERKRNTNSTHRRRGPLSGDNSPQRRRPLHARHTPRARASSHAHPQQPSAPYSASVCSEAYPLRASHARRVRRVQRRVW